MTPEAVIAKMRSMPHQTLLPFAITLFKTAHTLVRSDVAGLVSKDETVTVRLGLTVGDMMEDSYILNNMQDGLSQILDRKLIFISPEQIV